MPRKSSPTQTPSKPQERSTPSAPPKPEAGMRREVRLEAGVATRRDRQVLDLSAELGYALELTTGELLDIMVTRGINDIENRHMRLHERFRGWSGFDLDFDFVESAKRPTSPFRSRAIFLLQTAIEGAELARDQGKIHEAADHLALANTILDHLEERFWQVPRGLSRE